MAKGDDIEERLVDFAIRIVMLSDSLPKSRSGSHIATQSLRSGTAPAAHYAEARNSESANDFIHKLKLCIKELNETRIWLKIITNSGMQPSSKMTAISQECDELCRIINASITTARKNKN